MIIAPCTHRHLNERTSSGFRHRWRSKMMGPLSYSRHSKSTDFHACWFFPLLSFFQAMDVSLAFSFPSIRNPLQFTIPLLPFLILLTAVPCRELVSKAFNPSEMYCAEIRTDFLKKGRNKETNLILGQCLFRMCLLCRGTQGTGWW